MMAIKKTPEFKTVPLSYRDKIFTIEYFFRPGHLETILFLHGLGGAKENYMEACKSDALAEHTLVCFDNPGTGNSSYFEAKPLDVDDLVAITADFITALNLKEFILCGTSMGGLTTLLYLERFPANTVKAYINIEGNFLPEDCMFSSKVVNYDFETFNKRIFPDTIVKMKKNGNTGYHIIANNLQLNTNIRSYFNYSFQTVKYSFTGRLLEEYLELNILRLFIYSEANRTLSYIPQLLKKGMEIKEISDSDHFVFYDNPKELYEAIGKFIDGLINFKESLANQ